MIDCVNPLRLSKNGMSFFVRCNNCLLCRLRKRADWTLRIQNEASLYDDNSFVTLTYSDDYKPDEVNVRDFQLFMKKLRKDYPGRVRYFMSAEYGDHTERPHYHLILFGFPCEAKNFIEENWNKGFVSVSPLTPNRANYCCGYVQKKLDFVNNNERVVSLYNLLPNLTLDKREYIRYITQYCSSDINVLLDEFNLSDSEIQKLISANKIISERVPFCTMSRRPGLGYNWYKKNKDKIVNNYFIAWQGKRLPIPLYYKQLLYDDFPDYKESMMKFFEEFDIETKKKLLKNGFRFSDVEDEIYYNNLVYGENSWFGHKLNSAIGNGILSSAFDIDHKNRMRQKEIDLKKKNEIYLSKKGVYKNYV